jgi:hypothetical protein
MEAWPVSQHINGRQVSAQGSEEAMKARGAVLSRRGAYQAPVENWAELAVGEVVEVVRHAQVVARGTVEEVSLSGNVLWILPQGPQERQLCLKSDGVIVRRG